MTRGSTATLAAALALFAARAGAADLTVAGSIDLDYRAIFSSDFKLQPPGPPGIASTTVEIAPKLVVDVTRDTSVSVKVCAGCHGFEVDQAYAEVHFTPRINMRVGRINVPVGEFNARHDPANYTTPSKPLPYAMGDMLHYGQREFNLGVVPTPYSDDGLEVFGSLSGGPVLLDYTLYAVKGFAGSNDLDFAASRRFLDNNITPAVGTRVVASYRDFSLGASFGGGTYDDKNRLAYLLAGLELYGKAGRFTVRAEAIARRTDLDRSQPGYQFEIIDPFIVKLGWYGQLDFEATDWLTAIYRLDGLERFGVPLPGSALTTTDASIVRNTGALLFRPRGGFVFKLGYEYWSFMGAFPDEHVVRAGIVGSL